MGSASRTIAASWPSYKAQKGIITASKKVAAGTKLEWNLYSKMNGGSTATSPSWRLMSDAQKLQYYQAN